TAGQALAADEGEKKVTVKGEIWSRFEDNEHMSDPDSTVNDSFTYFPYRVRLGIEGKFADNVTGYAEFHNFGFFGGDPPVKSIVAIPTHFDLLPFYLNTTSSTANDIAFVYPGYLQLDKIGGSNVGVRIGRQEHTYNTEMLLGDNDFYGGTSFDGGRAWWTAKKLEIDAF